MPGRTYTAGTGYRYGFNGKENDNEVKGTGNQQDYGMRIYDPRLGRFLSVDPLFKGYPWYTPYQFAGNTPMQAIDLDGLEEYVIIKDLYKNGSPKSVKIYYVVQKDDVTQIINHHFREITGKNPDGTDILGDYLTDQKVIRLVRSADGSESVEPGASLSKQEQAIVDQKSKNNVPTNPENKTWYFKTRNKNFTSETERNTDLTQDKIASRTFAYDPPKFNNMPLKQNSTLSDFTGSNNYYYGGSYNPMGGQLGNDLIASLNTLAGQLKSAENITSITINLNQAINADVGTSQYNTAQQYGQSAVLNMVNLLQARLKGTGIKVNAGTTNTTPNTSPADLKTSGKATGVNIKID